LCGVCARRMWAQPRFSRRSLPVMKRSLTGRQLATHGKRDMCTRAT
jgi:hypothetical protein